MRGGGAGGENTHMRASEISGRRDTRGAPKIRPATRSLSPKLETTRSLECTVSLLYKSSFKKDDPEA